MSFPRVPLWLSGLRIWHCHYSGSDHCCGVGLIPGLGTFACHGHGQKKKKLNKKIKCHIPGVIVYILLHLAFFIQDSLFEIHPC